jgi:hypothetical protein
MSDERAGSGQRAAGREQALRTQDSGLRTPVRRRAVLAALGAVAALAACGGPDGQTTFLPAGTATPPGGAGTATAGTTDSVPTAPRSSPVGTIIATPAKGAAVPDLLRMLAFVPNAQDPTGGLGIFFDRWKGNVTFANLGMVKKLYGMEEVRSLDDLKARNISATDFTNATGGCYLSDFTGASYASSGEYRAAFGFDAFQIDREISAGQPIDNFSRMEGAFTASAVVAQLQAGGYALADYNGVQYYTAREDGQIGSLSDPRVRVALARMNRVAVSDERIVAAPKTAHLTGELDAEARKTATLDAVPALHAVASVLGDVTSMATLPPGTSDVVEAVLQPGALVSLTRDWGTLHVPELAVMGYTDAGGYKRTMHVALVYTTPADAAADAPELVKRITGYRSLRTQQPLIPTYATAVVSRTATAFGKGVLVADVTLTPEPARGRFWLDMLFNRDTLFLVAQPLKALGTATPGASGSPRAATARPGGTP